jgi:hypothetical protein
MHEEIGIGCLGAQVTRASRLSGVYQERFVDLPRVCVPILFHFNEGIFCLQRRKAAEVAVSRKQQPNPVGKATVGDAGVVNFRTLKVRAHQKLA